MPRSLRTAWVLSSFLVVACSALVDFDRDKLAATAQHDGMDASVTTPGMDAHVGHDTSVIVNPDEPDTAVPGTDDDATLPGSCSRHADCPRNRLCCGGMCVATQLERRCTDCEAGCSPSAANICNERSCGCGNGPSCGADRPYCAVNGASASCVACRDANDCEGHADGRSQCIQGTCATCDPTNNSGCSGNTPICNATTLTCEACKATPDNCPGASVCTQSGACGGCTANDAADCTNPTTPICNLTAPVTTCRGCASDTECMTELSRPYCIANQRCSVCNPTNDAGCTNAAQPDCRLNANGVYQCQACTASSCASGTVCDTSSGRCVQCRSDNDCDGNSATPYCDTAMGVCRGCTSAGNGAAANNAWCSVNTLLARQICHSGGRCIRCDASNNGCGGLSPPRCQVDTNAPQNNICVECRIGVAGDCSGATPFCATNNRCRGCTAATEIQDCPPNTANPVCDTSSGRCVPCVPPARGCAGTNGSCLAGASAAQNSCVDCVGTINNECSGQSVCDTARHMCVRCLTAGNAGCNSNQLCCNGACVAHDATNCTACTVGCTGASPVCLSSGSTFQCGCSQDSQCPLATPQCLNTGMCGACSGDAACTGRGETTHCVAGNCRRCVPNTITGCTGGLVCDATFTCVSPPDAGGGTGGGG